MKAFKFKLNLSVVLVILVLLIIKVTGLVSCLNNGTANSDITYIDKTANGNIDISFSDNGDIVVKDEENSKSDVYFAGSETNFLNFRQQKTRIKSSEMYYTNYELELLAYTDNECKNLVKYVISWGEEFEIYQVIEFREVAIGSYLTSLSNNYSNFQNELRNLNIYVFNSEEVSDYNGATVKGLNTFEMCSTLYLDNGEHKLELTSEKNLLEVFTIMLKTVVNSQDSESDGTQINVSLNINDLCNVKIYNAEKSEYQNVTNNVCLHSSLLKFARVWEKNTVYIMSECAVDFPLELAQCRANSIFEFTMVDLTDYVIKY